ncbi:MAG: PstS family phosphate ABC transporter substrate-binding protein [Synechococcales cyanobacterium RM1_1_8]|nr:PstS family phosphate ABC transporter substrate-binding protein [Synechococcales cyanobacterium RM1_1_8]
MTSKTKTLKQVAAASAMLAVAATSVITVQQAVLAAKVIKIDGSSTVFPITEGVAERFQKNNPTVKVTVGVSGTGGGFKKFCAGETDISNASRPIKDSEKELCAKNGIKYMEMPVAYDALTVVVNQNSPVTALTTAELKKIWEPAAQGKIKTWNQVNSKFPNTPIRLFGPGADSGTFDYFTEEINGKSGASRTDFTASEDDNVLVRGVGGDKGSLGYFGFAYYLANQGKLNSVAINGVKPTKENVLNGKYKPLSRPVFIYVSDKAAKKGEVRAFVQYYLKNAKPFVDRVGYIALPDSQYNSVASRFNAFR